MTVLVLCHGNICRSPLAGELMRRAGVQDVVTAGFKPAEENGKKSPKKVRDWAKTNANIDLSEHRSQAVTREMLVAADIILYMDSGQLSRLEAMWDALGLRAERGPMEALARPLGAWLIEQKARIGDPMFQKPDTAEFVNIMGQLVEASGRFAEYWKNQRKAVA